MNVCCGDALEDNVNYREFGDIFLMLNRTTLKFVNEEGKFYVLDTDDPNTDLNDKKRLIDELRLKSENKDKEIQEYLLKIRDLDIKLDQMEKLLIQDKKEQEYINLIGQ